MLVPLNILIFCAGQVESFRLNNRYYKILTDREFSVLQAFAMGQAKAEISRNLDISAHTVNRHKHSAMRKLGVDNDADLLRFALKKGFIKNKGGLNWTASHNRPY